MTTFINIFTGFSTTSDMVFDEIIYHLHTQDEIYEITYQTTYEK